MPSSGVELPSKLLRSRTPIRPSNAPDVASGRLGFGRPRPGRLPRLFPWTACHGKNPSGPLARKALPKIRCVWSSTVVFLAKPRRRKERQQKDPLCDSASWRETVFRISVHSVDAVLREESAVNRPATSAERALHVKLPSSSSEWQKFTGSRECREVNARGRFLAVASSAKTWLAVCWGPRV